ncbi:hypothetical protein [Streptococcus sciuri]|uniref:Nucleotide modification associated domain-containing protein n=1 Tax=Streptococcus sciuri TaxID=2973939 RepID=A0ABT2F686_9STRE|nr:hypothetical protein [Streptococcus sciuri]MCS4487988.1 hypothetical protein [Streptococcus sciuri]
MKIILSRKGFDSSNGGIPSPILPDGTLLSLPIPAKIDQLSFDDLHYNGVSYAEILRQLRGRDCKEHHFNCHLDPDIRKHVRSKPVENWQAGFGQINAAQGLLRNQGVGVGDLFLFFGWFRQTEGNLSAGTLRYRTDAPDLNIIYGYLQVGELVHQKERLQNQYPFHPHSLEERANKPSNILYLSQEKLSFAEDKEGYGVFNYAENRVLTKEGKSRSIWKEIPALFPENLCGNHKNSAKNGGISYAGIWQEKVLQENSLSESWAQSLFE